jgi:hypothetical protein
MNQRRRKSASAGCGKSFLFPSGICVVPQRLDASRQFQFQFTDFSVGQGGTGNILWSGSGMPPFQSITFQDCWLRGSSLAGNLVPAGAETVNLINNLCLRSQIIFAYYDDNNPNGYSVTVNDYNNLFWNGIFDVTAVGSQSWLSWSVVDNLFDGAIQNLNLEGIGPVWGYNGFTAGTTDSYYDGHADITGLTADYQSGPLGDFYYPSSGSGDLFALVNAGSRSASAAGLTGYTTQANQAHDCDTVDIGFHYMATWILPPDAFWTATDISDPSTPIFLGNLQAPFGNPCGYPSAYDDPAVSQANTIWPTGSTWSNHIVLNLSGDLSQIEYSIAIDNDYQLYVNGTLVAGIPPGEESNPHFMWSPPWVEHGGPAEWTPFNSLSNLQTGNNNIDIIIKDDGTADYFSMMITNGACSQ